MTHYIRLKGLACLTLLVLYSIIQIVIQPHEAYANRDYSQYVQIPKTDKINTIELPTDDNVPFPVCRENYINLSSDKHYPVPHWIFSLPKAANKALILAIVKTESRFRPSARSHRGAVGLMQIMPQTADYMISKGALDIKLADSRPDFVQYMPKNIFNFKDPYINLALGHHYVKYLQEKAYIGENVTYLLAAYNAGPGNVHKWQKRYGNISEAAFAARIPYRETRNYVNKVMRDYKRYQKLIPKIDNTVWVNSTDC